MKSLLITFPAILLSLMVYPEGIKQLAPDSTYNTGLSVQPGTTNCFAMESCNANNKLYVHIDHPGEKVFMGFGWLGSTSVNIKIKLNGSLIYGPFTVTATSAGYIKYFKQAYTGPNVLGPDGYVPVSFVPQSPGDYEIDFLQSVLNLTKIDVTVIDTAVMPLAPTNGRLWAKKWIMRTNSITFPENAFLGSMYIYSEDSVVTSIYFNKMQGDYFQVSCNANGCFPPPVPWDSSCQSTVGEYVYPQYKIFVNNPDSLCYPTGTLGTIDPGSLSATPSCDGSFSISFYVGKPGKINAVFEINPLPGIQSEDVTIMSTVLAGWNTIIWDGVNGLGQPVPAGAQVPLTLTFINGLTNLPIFDVERQVHGFVITQVRPPGAAIATYWNDTLLANKGGRSQLDGCYSHDTVGCHRWYGYYFGVGIGSQNTVNTWWYATSSTLNPLILTVRRAPGSPENITGPLTFCRSAVNLYTIVPGSIAGADPGSYEWILTGDGTGTVLLHLQNQGPAVTISFTTFPTGGMHLKVRGSNALCGTGPYGPGLSGEGIQLYSNEGPQILNTETTQTLCSGEAVNLNLQSSMPSTNWSYTVTATSVTLSGYSAGSANPVQQTISNTGNETDTVVYHVVPMAQSCPGDTTDFFAVVTPVPRVVNADTVSQVCSGNTTSIPLISNLPAATFTWTATASSADVTGYSDSGGPVIAQTLVNSGISVQTVSYMVTPAINSCTGTSRMFIVTVTPGQPVTVSVSASNNPFCSGSFVTFTATPVNGGANPGYQWKVNSTNAGNNSAVFSYNPLDGDQVSCILTSSNVSCISNNPASSNIIDMVSVPSLEVSVTISASLNPFCPGTEVAFTANAINGGPSPAYQWMVNGSAPGFNPANNVFIFTPVDGDLVSCKMTSNLACVTSNPASSNTIVMVALPKPTVSISPCFDTITSINARPFNLRGGLPLGGIYSGSGVNSVAGIFTPSVAGTGTKTISYTYQNTYTCTELKTTAIKVLSAPVFNCGGSFTDPRDQKKYPTVQIGSQCWIQKNLEYGAPINSMIPQTDNCLAENYLTLNTLHLTLYQWDELMRYDPTPGAQGLCPAGWHVPSDAEWSTLFNFYQSQSRAAKPLQDTLTNGFSALLSGVLYSQNFFRFEDFATFFWSSTSFGSDRAMAHGMNSWNFSVSDYPALRGNGFAARCIRD